MLTTIRINVRTQSPLQHGAFASADTGNVVSFRRVPIVLADGTIRQIPCVAGNSLRGRIRRVLMRGLLEWAGIRDLLCDAGEGVAYQHLYAALVNGGHLREGVKRVDPEVTRKLREDCPPLSALGSALFDRLLAGRCDVRVLWPVCRETVDMGTTTAPEGYSVSAVEDLVTEWSHVRHIDADEHDPEVTGVSPMPVVYEVIAPGALLQSSVICRGSALEASAIAWALDRIETIGGGSAKGLGLLRVEHDGDAGPYQDWLDTRREQIRSFLLDLARGLVPDAKPAKKGRGKAAPVADATEQELF